MDGMFALRDVTRPLLDNMVEIMRQRRDEFKVKKKRDVFWKKE